LSVISIKDYYRALISAINHQVNILTLRLQDSQCIRKQISCIEIENFEQMQYKASLSLRRMIAITLRYKLHYIRFIILYR
ncbi:hypothetical protein VEZ01S_22_00560, partial [Vibrio ezurae NBRC 102218]